MRQRNFNAIRGCARLLFIACVLASLCFSVAEGVRLLPFPVSHAKENSAPFEKKSAGNYSPSLHQSIGQKPGKLIRNKKSGKDHQHNPVLPAEKLCPNYLSQTHFYTNGQITNVHTALFLVSPSDRAPPV